jgi:ADP-ribose pyrophosphatase YjhB (NUDIX family)
MTRWERAEVRPGAPEIYFNALALLWARGLGAEDDELLLVQQKGPGDGQNYWALPGGRIERGELLMAGLLREVRQETGLQIAQVGELVLTARLDNQDHGYQSHTRVFTVQGWRGELLAIGPDRLILDVAFVPREEAVRRLAQIPWLIMREPLLAYLQGKAAPGCVWLYSQQGNGAPALIRRLQGPPAA